MHLAVMAQAMNRFNAQLLAYCLIGNRFHLVLHTRQANLSRLMRHHNGVYAQSFNRRHGLSGHLFQGRFKAILVNRDAYLMAWWSARPTGLGLAAAHTLGLWQRRSGWTPIGCTPTCWARKSSPCATGVARCRN